MHLNKLRDTKKLKGETFKFSKIGAYDNDESSEEEENAKDIYAYDIDSDCNNGKIALIYKNNYTKP